MSLAVKLPLGVLELIFLLRGPIFPELVEVLDLEHFEVVVLKCRSPALTKVFLGIASILGVEI